MIEVIEKNTRISTRIQETLYNHDFEHNKSLFGGSTGQALYFSIIGNFLQKESYVDKSVQLFSDIIDFYNRNENFLSKSNNVYTYCSGLAGLGVSLNFLVDKNFLDFEIDEFNENLSQILIEKAIIDLNRGNYDFLHGAIGIGLYLLEVKGLDEIIINRFVEALDQIKLVDENQNIYWRESYRKDENKHIINFSLSHGMSSIIIFLARAYEKGYCKSKCQELSKRCVDLIISNLQDLEEYGHHFPNILLDSKPIGGQLSWCYGEIGVALALRKFAKTFSYPLVEDLALKIFVHNAKKTVNDANRPLDGAICHGAAGLLMMFNRLDMYYDKEIFKSATQYWYQYMINFSKFEDGICGYKAFNGHTREYDMLSYGLLEGVMGIDLVLTTYENKFEQDWDKMFLIS